MRNQIHKFTITILFCLLTTLSFAQKSEVYANNQRIYNRATELYNHDMFGEAQKHFIMFAERTTEREMKINAYYFAGVCAMELLNPDAVNLLLKVGTQYTDHSKSKPALFQLGKYFYRLKDNKNAVKYLSLVGAEDLTPEQAEHMFFIKGYCYFKLDDFENAKKSLGNIIDNPNKYLESANYYYGYIIYREGKYEQALEHFTKVGKNKIFGGLSQVYIAQIYFAQKKYVDVVSFADTITNKEIVNDVAGIVGQSYFQLGNYNKALPFLERFHSKSPNGKTNQDIYRLGYSYLRVGDHAKAIEYLSKIAIEKDSTSQFASYHLAEAYLATNQKQAARLAFDRAYHNGFNSQVTELSLFNHAKLSFELSFQQEALKDLVKFVNDYSSSDIIDEAKSMMSDLLTATKNYKDAIPIIESINKPNTTTQLAYQRVCYYRAEELYLNNDYVGAKSTFTKSQLYELDKKLYALASFWLAEIAFREGQFAESIRLYKNFQKYPEVKDTRFYPLSFYNMAYSHLKVEDYDNCISEMKKFTATEYALNNIEIYTDANMRIADCYLVLRQYQKALDQYSFITEKNLNGSDYALYQKATIYGVLNRADDKIAMLSVIINQYKKSTYIDDAVYEISLVKMQSERFNDAITGYQNIIDNYPRSQYLRKAIQNKGLCYYNTNRDKEALEVFKQLITEYPNTPEARDALMVAKNIFVSNSDADGYLEYVKVLPNVELSPTYQDSITYESAFNAYKSGDCNKSSKLFGNYINRFPGGFFILRANYYKAECDFSLKNYDSALVCYEFVSLQNRNEFTEKSTRQTAVLYYMKKNFAKALDNYASLERIASNRDNLSIALTGQIKSAAQLGNTEAAAAASIRYLNSTVTQKDGIIEARLNMARFYQSRNQIDSAMIDYQFVAKETKNIWAAESKYQIAFIQYLRKDLKACKKTIFDIADNLSVHEYWVAKSYLLLADVYVAEKDNFQAKATLQSILENYDGEDVKSIASEKLKVIIASEEASNKKIAPSDN
jgi:TolA-binding protein